MRGPRINPRTRLASSRAAGRRDSAARDGPHRGEAWRFGRVPVRSGGDPPAFSRRP
ncbi:hypothetical protein BURPSS13_L0094 [Burkholderia pseudomallei S13]|nr:hypothetical protein BURPSS13_L0094 [Burkholderia pseudomallei S13]